MTEKLVYTLKEVQALLGFGRKAVYSAIHDGTIPSVQIGRRIVVRKQDLDDLLAGKLKTAPKSKGKR